jgi:hypothetical protein
MIRLGKITFRRPSKFLGKEEEHRVKLQIRRKVETYLQSLPSRKYNNHKQINANPSAQKTQTCDQRPIRYPC